jgi:hypothetical protein
MRRPPVPRVRSNSSSPLFQPIISRRIAELALHVKQPLREVLPHRFVDGTRARVLVARRLHRLAELLVGDRGPREPDDRLPRRQQPIMRERVKPRHQLALRQIARRPEDHQTRRLRHALLLQSLRAMGSVPWRKDTCGTPASRRLARRRLAAAPVVCSPHDVAIHSARRCRRRSCALRSQSPARITAISPRSTSARSSSPSCCSAPASIRMKYRSSSSATSSHR